jgi:ketosteroid isomerase-like protein
MRERDAAIIRLEQQWVAAEIAGDATQLGTLLADDCLLVDPVTGVEVCGRDAVVEAVTAGPPIVAVHCDHHVIGGGLAAAWKQAAFRTEMVGDTGVVTVTGRHLWLLRHHDQGWRIRALTFEVDPAVATQTG